MADEKDTKAEASAEKAYAAATEVVSGKDEQAPVTSDTQESKPAAVAAPSPEPVPGPATTPVVAKAPVKKIPAKAAAPKVRKAAATPKKAAKPAVAAPTAPKRTVKPKGKTASPSPRPKAPASLKPTVTASFKEKTMAKTSEFAEGFQKIASEAQEKAKEAFEKSSALFGEYGEFAKGNFEAFVEASKIFTTGVQELGSEFATESRVALETASSDVKELAGAKSPTEFLKLQGDIVRRNVDSAVAYSSKNSEAFLKLAGDAFKPISGRFSLALEKARKAA